jgi:hypothetical protein
MECTLEEAIRATGGEGQKLVYWLMYWLVHFVDGKAADKAAMFRTDTVPSTH